MRADAINSPPKEVDTPPPDVDTDGTDKKRKLESPTSEHSVETGASKKQTLVASENTKSKLAAFTNN